MKITKKQVKEAYNNAEKLKEWYPEAFDITLDVGVWYKSTKGTLFNYQKDCKVYGFKNGLWHKPVSWSWTDTKSITKATKQEIETALIAEAKKRGFDTKESINWEFDNVKYRISFPKYHDFYFNKNTLYFGGGVVFQNGTWAEIIKPKQMTKDEATSFIEKELGYKIEIV